MSTFLGALSSLSLTFYSNSVSDSLAKDTLMDFQMAKHRTCYTSVDSITYCLEKIPEKEGNNWLLFQPEVDFWIQNIQLSEDSFLVVDQVSRGVLDILHKKEVLEIEKGGNLKCLGTIYKGSCFDLEDVSIKFVRGRKSFFDFQHIGKKINSASEIFEGVGVSPLYAQLLLLIESPNNPHSKSIAGALGYFQLMPEVARKYGLIVNNNIDERASFEKSAKAAAKLFKNYCIPSAVSICEALDLSFEDDDLWFQLLALHIYNAGAGNVKKAAFMHVGVTDGKELIKLLWHTKKAAFGNSSQNYSQLCLASYRAYLSFLQTLNVTQNVEQSF
jgi:hypothetical protein